MLELSEGGAAVDECSRLKLASASAYDLTQVDDLLEPFESIMIELNGDKILAKLVKECIDSGGLDNDVKDAATSLLFDFENGGAYLSHSSCTEMIQVEGLYCCVTIRCKCPRV